MMEDPRLYELAKQICHEQGLDYYDPRTGRKYPPPPERKQDKKKNPKEEKKR